MTRRCSHCSTNGHNSRTCPSRVGGGCSGSCSGGVAGGSSSSGSGGVKLFGVRLTDGSFIKKSASMGNLSTHYLSSSSAAAASTNPTSPSSDHFRYPPVHVPDGYLSDDPNQASSSSSSNRCYSERKKGVPWTEEEHRLFLIGLQQLGKGDWRGIARKYVMSRTPTQVASHAQKYFIRQTNATRRKRRSSLFDMVPDMVTEQQPTAEEKGLAPLQAREPDNACSLPSLNLTLSTEAEPMEAMNSDKGTKESSGSLTIHGDMPRVYPAKESGENMTMSSSDLPPVIPSFLSAYLPVPLSLWQQDLALARKDNGAESSHHEILKPIPILGKEPVNIDEVDMSHLNLNETADNHIVSPQLSLNLFGEPSRQSAFRASPPSSTLDLSEGANSAIKAV
ncbi:hypothetical protein Dimus_027671 [Dionaea muscipula]